MLKLGTVRREVDEVIAGIVVESKNDDDSALNSRLLSKLVELIRQKKTNAVRIEGNRKQTMMVQNRSNPTTSSTTTSPPSSVPDLVIPDADMWRVERIYNFAVLKFLVASKPTNIKMKPGSRITAR